MQSNKLHNKGKMEIIIVKGGCCPSSSGSIADLEKCKSMLTEISFELNTNLSIKEITFSEALSGPYPDELKSKGWGVFTSKGKSAIPMIIFNGQIISYGPPDKDLVANALQSVAKTQVL